MSKIFMSKKKTFAAITAVVLTAAIIFGGTFAWQSISQEALNEVSSVVNPGGRLHDDFVEITYDADGNQIYDTMTFNKDVYVENFTKYAENGVQVFARIRLDEYMEMGIGAGDIDAADRDVQSVVPTAKLDDKNSWTTHIPGNDDDPFHEYWDWTVNDSLEDESTGKVTYMPTYNKNKDSLVADINGTFEEGFTDYVDYSDSANATQNYYEIVDNDGNTDDELAQWNVDLDTVITTGTISDNYNQHVTVTQEEHTATESLSAYVITMEQWLALPADQKTGDFWVWDADGWAYWANPINPETATGVLLDGISRNKTVINEDWYYAINVVGQFITKDNLGKEDGTGFYAPNAGKTPSSNALILLNAIGVDVDTTVAEGDEAALRTALELGGNMTLTGTYGATENAVTFDDGNTASYMWATGGTMTGGTLNPVTEPAYATLFISARDNYPNEGDVSAAAVLNNVTVTSAGYGIYAYAVDNNITLNNVTITSNSRGGGLLAEEVGSKVFVNDCTIDVSNAATSIAAYQRTAIAAAQNASVVVDGGTYTGEYAAYVYSTGGSITILDGTFKGNLANDGAEGSLVIKGGSFSVDPTAYVDLNTYTVEYNESTQMYDVK